MGVTSYDNFRSNAELAVPTLDASTLGKKKNIVGGDGVTGIAPLNVVGIGSSGSSAIEPKP
jgi:hypothetical protein